MDKNTQENLKNDFDKDYRIRSQSFHTGTQKRVRIAESPAVRRQSLLNNCESPLYHPQFEQVQIDQIKKKGFKELQQFVEKFKGSLPVFGYPLISFEDRTDQQPTAQQIELWEIIKESVMVKAGTDEITEPNDQLLQLEQVPQQEPDQNANISLITKILNKHGECQEDEQNILQSFTYGKKIHKRQQSSHRNRDTENLNGSLLGESQLSVIKSNNSNFQTSQASIINGKPSENLNITTNNLTASFNKAQFDMTNNSKNNDKIKQMQQIKRPKTQQSMGGSKKNRHQESQFMQFVKSIRRNADLSNENMSQQMQSQFKVFRLLPNGQEEIDFVEWASDLNRNHPIAKAYQNLKKTHFDRLRRIQNSSFEQSPAGSPPKQKCTNQSFFSGNININNNVDILKKAQSQDNSHAKKSNKSRFNLKLESTQADSFMPKTLQTPGISYLNMTNSTFRNSNMNPNNYDNKQYSQSKSPMIPKEIRNFENNPISLNFPVKKSKHIAQVRKHLNTVKKANEYENDFLDQKNAKFYSTLNPLNLFYQIAQNPQYKFENERLLNPASSDDLKYLSQGYKDKCENQSKAARFQKTDYQYELPKSTSYLTKRPNSTMFMYSTFSGQYDLKSSNQSQSLNQNASIQVPINQAQQSPLQRKSTITPNTLHSSIIATMPNVSRIQREMEYKDKRRSSIVTATSFNRSTMTTTAAAAYQRPVSTLTINDKDNTEPEVPLTGYNFQRYYNESNVVMKAAESANKLRELKSKIDSALIRKREEERKTKFETLLNRGKGVKQNRNSNLISIKQ